MNFVKLEEFLGVLDWGLVLKFLMKSLMQEGYLGVLDWGLHLKFPMKSHKLDIIETLPCTCITIPIRGSMSILPIVKLARICWHNAHHLPNKGSLFCVLFLGLRVACLPSISWISKYLMNFIVVWRLLVHTYRGRGLKDSILVLFFFLVLTHCIIIFCLMEF